MKRFQGKKVNKKYYLIYLMKISQKKNTNKNSSKVKIHIYYELLMRLTIAGTKCKQS